MPKEETVVSIPKGHVRVNVSSWDDEKEGWYWSATKAGVEVARVWGMFWVNVPTTPEAQAEAMAKAKTTFATTEGRFTIEGPAAPAARKYYSDAIEPVRGELRDLGAKGTVPDAATLQGMLDAASPYTGRGGRKAKPITKGDLEAASKMDEAELAAFFIAKGFTVTT